jgi:putative inorganic carbon (hco3(-)) transporter
MGFLFLMFYLFASFIFPAEVFPSLAPYHLPFWIGVGGLAISVILVFVRRGEPLRSIQVYVLFAFFGVLMLSWLFADRTWAVIPETIQQFGPSVAMFVMTLCAVDSLKKLSTVTGFVVLLTLIVLAQGFAAYHFGINSKMFVLDPAAKEEKALDADVSTMAANDDVTEPDESEEAEEEEGGLAKRIRGLGMLHDPNDLALSFVSVLPLASIGMKRWRALKFLLELILTGMLCYGVFLTHSRGGMIGLLFVVLWLLAGWVGRWRALLLVGILAAGTLSVVDVSGGRGLSQDESSSDRVDAWREGIQMLRTQPVLGVGYRQFTEHNYITAHNSFVLCFAETGFVGYFLWLSLLGITLLQLHKLSRYQGHMASAAEPEEDPESVSILPDIRRHASILQAALIGFMVAAFFLSRTYIPLLYLLVGLSAALVLIAKKNGVPVSLPTPFRMGSLIVAAELASIVLIYFIGKLQVVA